MDDILTLLLENSANKPYFHLDEYMDRWWLVEEQKDLNVSVRLHHLLRSDQDAWMHDHPFSNVSIGIQGGYWDITPKDQAQSPELDAIENNRVWCGPGTIISRKATDRHRIEIPEGGEAWSLFIMGPWTRDWGFHTADGWVYYRDYLGIPLDAPKAPVGSTVKAR